MALHQYIGARYVPLIFGPWQSGISYDPLTIVTYVNRSFTSKKPVPSSVGNPADNPDYWIESGSYNAQVSQLQNDVDALQIDVAALTNNEKLKERHIIFITASYGTKYTEGGESITDSLDEVFLAYSGWDPDYFHYSAVAGNSFSNDGFYTQLVGIDIGDAEPEDIKDIYFMGGWNDSNFPAATIRTKIETVDTYIKATYPNARVHIMSASWSYDSNKSTVSLRTALTAFKSAEDLGWLYHDNMAFVLHDTNRIMNVHGGGFHPNQDGVNEIAKALISLIETGNIDIYFTQTGNLTNFDIPLGSTTANAAMRIVEIMKNGYVDCQVMMTRGLLTFTSPQNIVCDGNAHFTLYQRKSGDDGGNWVLRGYSTRTFFPCTITASDGAATYQIPGKVYIANGVHEFFPNLLPTNSGTGTQTINGVVSISMPSYSGNVRSL